MKKIDIIKIKNYITNKTQTNHKKHYIQNPKKLLRDKSLEKQFNNTTYLNYNNPYLNNSKNLFILKENLNINIRGKRVSTPKKLYTKVNTYNFKQNRSRPKSSKIGHLPRLTQNDIFPSFNPSGYLNLETEKMNQEKYQLNKLVKNLENELYSLQKENNEKDKLLNKKEKEISKLITNSNLINEEENNKNNNPNNEENNIQNNASYNLYMKIKREIRLSNNEIKEEEKKINELKHNILYTKTFENYLEKNIIEEQIKKISSLIENALITKKVNKKKMEEIKYFEKKINIQNNILNELKERKAYLNENYQMLQNEIENNKSNLFLKRDKVDKNVKEIKSLIKKNKVLTKDKVIKHKIFRVINHNPISINSYYSNKITELEKLINFYKTQNKYNESLINKLTEQKKSAIESLQNKNIKYSPLFLSLKQNNKQTNQVNNINKIQEEEKIKVENKKKGSIKNEEEKIEELRTKYRKLKEEEKEAEKKVKEYKYKIRQLNEYIVQQKINSENNNNTENEKNQNEIEFGIDENNPYYTDNEENEPEKEKKFTSNQFNQFTYILFKNFESKGIVAEESKNKIINPFVKIVTDNKLEIVQYPSEQFNFIVEEFTKIILDSINYENEYNHILTKIFVSALLINSEGNSKKLIEYFSILFSYTRNYFNEEEKYLSKLRNKYKNQINKLIKCVNIYIENEKKEKNEACFEYFPLIQIKEIIEENNITLKDKYVEFLFYFLKKFTDKNAKLDELKYSLLNDILIAKDDNMDDNKEEKGESNKKEKTKDKEDKDKNELNKSEENINKSEKNDINDDKEKITENKDYKDDNISSTNNNINNNKEIPISESENVDLVTSKNNDNKDFTMEKKVENKSDMEESMTEITNEEYMKQINDAKKIIKNGLKKKNVTFIEFINDIRQNVEVDNQIVEFFTIDDFNEKLKQIGIILSDLKLSCLCSKYSIPNELRLIETKNIEEDINLE